MKKPTKVLLFILLALVVCATGGLAYLRFGLPNVGPPPELTVKADAALLQRGEYLFHHLSGCVSCHSERDANKFAEPVIASTIGHGSKFVGREDGFPGAIYAPNLTPVALGQWTDGEIFRAITAGVSKDGTPLFAMMPYHMYGQMDEEDVKAIIAYLRTLPPGGNQTPKRELDFPLSLIVRTMPRKAALVRRPDPSDAVAYGRYLVTAAACYDCHTPMSKSGYDDSRAFAGGREFKLKSGGKVHTANITPDSATGIGSWTQDAFVKRFKAHDPNQYQPRSITAGEFNTVMPWTEYSGLTEQDLGAMYTYLKTIKPVRQSVEKFKPLSAAVLR